MLCSFNSQHIPFRSISCGKDSPPALRQRRAHVTGGFTGAHINKFFGACCLWVLFLTCVFITRTVQTSLAPAPTIVEVIPRAALDSLTCQKAPTQHIGPETCKQGSRPGRSMRNASIKRPTGLCDKHGFATAAPEPKTDAALAILLSPMRTACALLFSETLIGQVRLGPSL
jgi:hypothetical protein